MFTALEKVGILCLTVIAYQIAKRLLPAVYNLFAPMLNLNVDVKSMGKWAVVTGGTDGLGRAFVEELARQGMDVVIISRTRSKLDALAEEIKTSYNVETKVIEADLAGDSQVFGKIEKELFGLEIGILVNNVGISYPNPDYFLNLSNKDKIYADIIQCNIVTLMSMCQIVMPSMVEARKGVVINVSSTASAIPSPLLSVYGASKSFVTKFSRDLAVEYKHQGIIVQCLLPGYVATKMSKIKKSSWMAPSPKSYVRSALKTLGIAHETTGYYPHTLLVTLMNFMESVSPAFAEWLVMKTMLNIRSRSMKKAARES